MATRFKPVYPKRFTMWSNEDTIVIGTTPLSTACNTSQVFAMTSYQLSPANGDTRSNKFVCAQGTYTVSVLCVTANSYGIVDFLIDDVVVSAGNDMYSAGTTYGVVKIFTVTLAAKEHTWKTVVNGKNAAAVSPYYYCALTKVWGKQASD